MKITKKSEASFFKNSENCFGYECGIEDKDMNMAVIDINGRYPESGYVLNEACKELIYVIEGEVELVFDGQLVNLNSGDFVLLDANKKYFWNGKCRIITVCNPAFYDEQHKLLD